MSLETPAKPMTAEEVNALATRRQRAAADPSMNVFVSANAGAGKTRVLVDRVVRLLLGGAPPERILCLTYTKTAANEMQDRLFQTLGSWSVKGDEGLVDALTKLDPEAPATTEAELRHARALFARALETPGGLRVQTIHAFCERLLRRFPLEADVEPGFEILDDAQAAAAAARARRHVASRAERVSDLKAAFGELSARLDDESMAAFLGWSVRFRSVVGKGGDERLDALAEQLGVPVGATAASERRAVWEDAPVEELKTCAAALGRGSTTDQGLAAGLERALAETDPARAYDLYLDALTTQAGDFRASFGTKKTVAETPALTRLFGDSKTGYGSEIRRMEEARERVRAAALLDLTRAGLIIAEAYLKAYADEKRRLHALDFTDLIEAARRLLTHAAAAQWVLYKLDGGVDHVLVDEAQDTAPEQWDLIEALTTEFYAGAGARREKRTTFIVGDEKQSIFSFQGADPVRFLKASRDLDKRVVAGGEAFSSITFETSFRCAPEVLKAVDATFQLPAVEAALFGADGPPGGDVVRHRASRATAPGLVEWWPLEPRRETLEPEDVWAPVDAPEQGDPKARLADRIARNVRDWIANGEGVADRKAEKEEGLVRLRPMRAGDVMILVRQRDAVFETVIRRLKSYGVAVAGADRMTLKAELAVEDLLGAARVALLPEDDLALAEFLKSPLVHPAGLDAPPIDEEALFDLAWGRKGRLWHALRDSKDKRFAEAATLAKDLIERAEREGPFKFLAGLIDRRSPTGESYARRLYHRLGPEAEDPVEELLSRALAHERRGAPSLERFVHETLNDDVQVKRDGGEAGDAVRVMTVHGAKGLEAPVVIVPDLGAPKAGRRSADPFITEDAGVVWSPTKAEDPAYARELRNARDAAENAERLRLLYVAMTRAEDRLIVCAPEPGTTVDPMSWHSLVEAGMKAADATAFEHELGEGLRLGGGGRAATSVEVGAPATEKATSLPAWATAPAPPVVRARRMVSPAQGLSETVAPPPALSPLAKGGAQRFRRGRLIHRLLEVLPEVASERREEAAQHVLKGEDGLDDAAKAALAAETFAILDDPKFAPLFGPDSRAEAPVAGGSPYLPKGVVVNGRVDRLAITADEVLIVDFKTDRPPPDQPEDVGRLYLEQMAAYRAVLRALYPQKDVTAALLWTDGPRLMVLSGKLLDSVLKSA
ncbi:MAG: double-strand break repair helicase AddA [Maricaulaceae bacterium]|jgi:ATP-dependent helicase/nuclease subunit A